MSNEADLVSKFGGLRYMDGFGSSFSSEALEGALPKSQNSPQVCPYGLYAEQLSGTAFTAPRNKNQRSWLYRIRPSVSHQKMIPLSNQKLEKQFETLVKDPNQLRWDPIIYPQENSRVTFVDGLSIKCGAGDSSMKEGLAVYDWSCNTSMINSAFYSADGDMLIVPQAGTLYIKTEFGKFVVEPCEIVVIPRGVKYQVFITGPCRGYAVEIFGGHFELPNLGPIGSNGLANPRDFQCSCAAFDNANEEEFIVISKFMNKLFQTSWYCSPFNVVAWHGNYTPFKYDLRKFNCINSVSYDHPDPSIYTVLTCPTNEAGVALIDFVIFPPRWIVANHTFRPPYFHRNCMSEYMGMIYGKYDAKAGDGFQPGGNSLHSCMSGHGPDVETFIKASSVESLTPHYFNDGLAFMFESTYLLKVAVDAMESSSLQVNYVDCWKNMPTLFDSSKKDVDVKKIFER